MHDVKYIPDYDTNETKIIKRGFGFGNYRGTLNPFILLARQIAKRYGNSSSPEYDYFITGWMNSGGSNAHILGYSIYKNDSKFISWFYHKILYPLCSFKRGLDYRFFRRQHKLKIKNISPSNWTDVDERMFHAMFTLLGDFVENELGDFKLFDDFDPRYQYRGYNLHSDDRPAINLWLWYKFELPKEEKAYKDYITKKYSKPIRFEKSDLPGFEILHVDADPHQDDEKYHYNYIEKLKDKKFMELCEIRRTLWT